MKRIASILSLIMATLALLLGIFEISFPEVFSWVELLDSSFPKLYRYAIWIGVGECALSIPFFLFSWKWDAPFFRKGFETLARIGLGGMFLFAAWFKVSDPLNFAILVAQYQFLPHQLVNFFSLVMPMAEVLFGFALIFLPFTRENAFALLWMFIAFIIALASALWRDLGITCGCFAIEGAQDKSEAWTSLIRDLVLLVPTIWLMFRPNRSLIRLWREHDAD